MTPKISGKKLRLRSPGNILAELSECYHRHGIRDFFFKSDTFTFDPKWTRAVCQAILDSPLAGRSAGWPIPRSNPWTPKPWPS